MEPRKLYVKGKCSICRGKHIGCFYCDADGLNYIEASDKLLREWFLAQSQERKDELKKIFEENS